MTSTKKLILKVFLSRDRYMNGAATNPDCHVLACAGAQVKKGLDIAKKLGAENFGNIYIVLILNMGLSFKCCCLDFNPALLLSAVFWGGREGFHSILNTDIASELKHMASFFRMAVGRCVLIFK